MPNNTPEVTTKKQWYCKKKQRTTKVPRKK